MATRTVEAMVIRYSSRLESVLKETYLSIITLNVEGEYLYVVFVIQFHICYSKIMYQSNVRLKHIHNANKKRTPLHYTCTW
jgi:hypothetical protein